MNTFMMRFATLTIALLVPFLGVTSVYAKDGGASEEHRNNTEKVVAAINKTADQDEEVKEELKSVAKEEDETGKAVSEAMKRVEERSGFKTFFVGSDYKNLGALRSTIVTTDNRIDRLTKAMERATSTTTKAELEAEITALRATKTNAEQFVKTHEDKFSLFGWLVRMFD